MSKSRRKIEVDPELLRRFLDLLERAREGDRKTAEVLAEVRQYQMRLRESYAGGWRADRRRGT